MHNALGAGRARRLAVEDPSRGLMPWVGVAAPLDSSPAPSLPLAVSDTSTSTSGGQADGPGADRSSSDAAASGTSAAVTPSGRAFCFLPLPIYTGMPARVHINGYFELSSNRRDIWCEACSGAAWHAGAPVELMLRMHMKVHICIVIIGGIPTELHMLSLYPCTLELLTLQQRAGYSTTVSCPCSVGRI